MWQVLVEGIRASVQPCSLALVVPGIGLVLSAARLGWAVALGYLTAASVATWANAARVIEVGGSTAVGVALAAVAILGTTAVVFASWHEPRPGWRGVAAGLLGGVLVGAAAAMLWQPCVGEQLGTILTAAGNGDDGQLAPMLVYQVGLLLGLAAVAALPWLDDGLNRVLLTPISQGVGLLGVFTLILALLTGQYADIIGRLVRISSLT